MLERTKLANDLTVLRSSKMHDDGFMVAFAERTGGVSDGPYRSLNLGLKTGDDAVSVGENRARLCVGLGILSFASGEQVHAAKVARVGPKARDAGFTSAETAIAGADALWTTSKDVPLAVLTADCVPLALANATAGVVAVVHAGWRGIAAGIVHAALERMGEPADVRAVTGPAVGPDHYEVQQDVAFAVSAATEGGAVVEGKGDRIRLDLPATVARILREHGVRAVERSEECTACDGRRFYSFRRDGDTGRHALVAMRLSKA